MKIKNYINNTILSIFFCFLATQLTAQKKQDKFDIISLNLIQSDLKVENGNLIISNKSDMTFDLNYSVNNGKGAKESFTIYLKFRGRRLGDPTKAMEYKKRADAAERIRPETPMVLTDVVVEIYNERGLILTDSVNISNNKNKKTSFAILLNGISKPNGNGNCFYGKCFCFASQDSPDSKLIELNTAKIKQTLSTNNKDKQSYLDITISINETSQNKDVPTLAQLVMWGEMDVYFSAEIAGKPRKFPYFEEDEDWQISYDEEVVNFRYRFNVTGLRDIRLTAPVLHFREVEGAYFGVSNVSLYLRDGKGYEKPTADKFTWTETWVIDQINNLSAQPKLKNVFMNQTDDSKTISVLIGLNKTKSGTPIELEKVLSTRQVKSYAIITWQAGNEKPVFHTVNASETKEGNWEYSDQIEKAKAGTPQFGMISLDMFFISPFNDTFKFTSVFKEKLGDKKDWNEKIHMSPIAIDNPVFEPANGGMNNVLGLTIPSSSVTVNGGSITFSENAKFSIGISNTDVVNGGFNYNKVPKVKFDIKNFDPNKRVFYHWGSVVSTSNPKLNVNVDSQKFKGHSISSAELSFITENNDTIVYESNGKIATSMDGKTMFLLLEKIGKRNYIDPCKTKYKLKEIFTQEGTESNIYGLYLSFNFENNSDLPAQISMNVEITDCNKKTQNIELKLNYDSKTGLYYATQAITTSSNCKLEITAGTVTVINECGVKTKWNFDASEAKAVGPGGKCSSNRQCRLQVCKLG